MANLGQILLLVGWTVGMIFGGWIEIVKPLIFQPLVSLKILSPKWAIVGKREMDVCFVVVMFATASILIGLLIWGFYYTDTIPR